jgi:hypothetical protein
VRRAARAALLLAGIALGGAAEAACRQALALGLDVSGSVDAREYRLQLDGLAAALEAPEVRAALLALPAAPVAVTVFEWSGPSARRSLVGWTEITDDAALAAVTARLRATGRAPSDDSTALGAALRHGAALLAARPDCWRHVLDISGDGKSNAGPAPQAVRRGLSGVTVNALVVGSDARDALDRRHVQIGELSSYFNAHVIRGPDAFVETALGYEDFARAMRRKLLRELAAPSLARIDPAQAQ